MSELLRKHVVCWKKDCAVIGCVALALLMGPRQAAGDCGCMDLALVADDSGSMGGANSNIRAQLPSIIGAAQAVSGGDLRMAVVTFPNVAGQTNDGVTVRQAFTTDSTLINNAVQALQATGGFGEPESSDAALQYVVDGTTDTGCTISNAPLGSFRSGCTKIAVIITDAHPGGCSDTFTPGVDDVHAASVAADAAAAGVKIAAIYVPTSGEIPDIKAIMQNYASITGGSFIEPASDGSGAGQGIVNFVASQQFPNTNSVGATRTSRFWFTHAFSLSDCTCATLLKAIQLNAGTVDLGFLTIPAANRNADNVINSYDALIEALSFYYKNSGKTGEDGGTQSRDFKGSSLCKARKQLAVELLAAVANIQLLHTDPSGQTYFNGTNTVSFAPDLLQQARAAGSSDDPATVRAMTALLMKFNNSGSTNNFPTGLVECSPQKTKDLKTIALDPTTQATCPGSGNTCDAPTPVAFPNASNPFARPIFKSSVTLPFAGTNSVAEPTCFLGSVGGPDAVWLISPTTIGTAGRQFTVDTSGSNFDTLISVWSGPNCSNLTQIACANSAVGVSGERLSFSTDGTNTYRIVVEGPTGQFGRLKVKITGF